ncbi:hypothetical protein E2320_012548, partial [Naja naja]
GKVRDCTEQKMVSVCQSFLLCGAKSHLIRLVNGVLTFLNLHIPNCFGFGNSQTDSETLSGSADDLKPGWAACFLQRW